MTAPKSTFGYTELSSTDQTKGIKARIRELEATHMHGVLQESEIDAVAHVDDSITLEQVAESKAGILTERAATETRIILLRELLSTYEN